MTTVNTVPQQVSVFRLPARSSFALTMWIQDQNGLPLDITGCILRIVARKTIPTVDDNNVGNLITSSTAVMVSPGVGQAQFRIQASELDWEPGEYMFVIVLVANGYTSPLMQGVIEIEDNPDYLGIDQSFGSGSSTSEVFVQLKDSQAVTVYAGHVLAPGTTSFSNADKTALDLLSTVGYPALLNKPAFGTAAFVNVADIAVPAGGSVGAVLTKASGTDYNTVWAQVAVGGTGLTATGQPAGSYPRSNGGNGWDWTPLVIPVQSVNAKTGVIVLNADDIAETASRKWVTSAMKTLLGVFSSPPNYTDLTGLPTLGTAAQRNDSYFLRSGIAVPNAILPKPTGLLGTSRGTGAPSGGADGDQYRQYV